VRNGKIATERPGLQKRGESERLTGPGKEEKGVNERKEE